jgi:hypothetical protein
MWLQKMTTKGYLDIFKGSQTLIVAFAGHGLKVSLNPIFEFKNFLTKTYPDTDLLFLKDDRHKWYTKGIVGISTDVMSTLEFLRKRIKNYKNVVFIGSSAGGYAAILFGSLLHVHTILAFRPQTKLMQPFVEEKYRDLKPLINSTTIYHIYGETCNPPGDLHSFEHCTNIAVSDNVKLTSMKVLDIRALRDIGWVKDEFLSIIPLILSLKE